MVNIRLPKKENKLEKENKVLELLFRKCVKSLNVKECMELKDLIFEIIKDNGCESQYTGKGWQPIPS